MSLQQSKIAVLIKCTKKLFPVVENIGAYQKQPTNTIDISVHIHYNTKIYFMHIRCRPTTNYKLQNAILPLIKYIYTL